MTSLIQDVATATIVVVSEVEPISVLVSEVEAVSKHSAWDLKLRTHPSRRRRRPRAVGGRVWM